MKQEVTLARNGAAIIGGMMVPPAEVKVLRALLALNRPATVPELAATVKDSFSDVSLYALLGRLNGRRLLVERSEVKVDVLGSQVRRVVWSVPRPIAEMITGSESWTS